MGTISRNFSWSEFEDSPIAKAKGILNVINTFEIRDSVQALGITAIEDYGTGLKRALASYFGALYIIYDPVKLYMTIADSEVERILATKYGDGVGISLVQVKAITSFGYTANAGYFRGNTTIRTFDEFEQFTGYKTIYGYTFNACTNLSSIVLPPTVTYIGIGAFAGCTSLTSITLPASLTTVARAMFQRCTNLVDVICLAATPPACDPQQQQKTYFDGCTKLAHIYVPWSDDGSIVNAYKVAYGWDTHASKIVSLNEDGSIPE